MADIVLPPELLPADGRFGSGPSKVRTEAVEALARGGADLPGDEPPTRRCPVRRPADP